jgi:hypothetical protein
MCQAVIEQLVYRRRAISSIGYSVLTESDGCKWLIMALRLFLMNGDI